jgi:type II secretory pathway pseudopilin PulG
MDENNLNYILKAYLRFRKSRSSNKGFTILEILMAILITAMVLYAMLSLVVNLLGLEKRETAKNQVQQDMGQAIDYIATELKQAVYIYEGQNLENLVSFPDEVHPILGFWKIEKVPYRSNPEGNQKLPDSCSGAAASECYQLKTSRNTYTLVIYSLKRDNTEIWEGPARITRFQLRKYDPDNLANLTKNPGYVDPDSSNFADWSPTEVINYSEAKNADVLVDLVDYHPEGSVPDCGDYMLSTPTLPDNNTSFYACVKPRETATNAGEFAEAIVYLRGNAAERAGKRGSRNSVYLPSLQRRVQARSVFNRTPPGF